MTGAGAHGYRETNRALWDEWTGLHEGSDFYDVAGFKAGKDSLRPIEVAELGDVAGKRLLHLMCHFGLDTLSWARRGAIATGTDISARSIALAQRLAEELGIPASFVRADVYDLPRALAGTFDVVYTSYGVLHWLPDLAGWARVIAHFLEPGGVFYMVETHPFMRVFDTRDPELRAALPYFYSPEPYRFEARGSYAAPSSGKEAATPGYMWDHGIGEVVTSLASAGLRVEYLHEFPYSARQIFPGMEQGEDGWWRLPGERQRAVPLLFSLRATRDAR